MSLINDPTTTISTYPNALDTFPTYTNSLGAISATSATIWNKIETALYRLQTHSQAIPLFFDSADRHRVCVSGTVFIAATGSTSQLVVMSNFTAAQLAFLNGGLTRSGSLITASVMAQDTTDDCTTDVLLGSSSVSVLFKRTDPTQLLSVGHYLISVLVLGY